MIDKILYEIYNRNKNPNILKHLLTIKILQCIEEIVNGSSILAI